MKITPVNNQNFGINFPKLNKREKRKTQQEQRKQGAQLPSNQEWKELLSTQEVGPAKKTFDDRVKLKEVLNIEFGTNKANDVLNYMLEKYEQKISRQTAGIEEKEQKIFGKYVVNYYKKTDGNPVFYVSLK